MNAIREYWHCSEIATNSVYKLSQFGLLFIIWKSQLILSTNYWLLTVGHFRGMLPLAKAEEANLKETMPDILTTLVQANDIDNDVINTFLTKHFDYSSKVSLILLDLQKETKFLVKKRIITCNDKK